MKEPHMPDNIDAQPDPEAERLAQAHEQERLAFLSAMGGEYRIFLEATGVYLSRQVEWLSERAAQLNVETRKRDERIMELERELAAYRLSSDIDSRAGTDDPEAPGVAG
jgi:hypothetical protein